MRRGRSEEFSFRSEAQKVAFAIPKPWFSSSIPVFILFLFGPSVQQFENPNLNEHGGTKKQIIILTQDLRKHRLNWLNRECLLVSLGLLRDVS